MNKKQIHRVTKEDSLLCVGVVRCDNCGIVKYIFHSVLDDYEQDLKNITNKSRCCENPRYVYDIELRKKWVGD